MKTTSRLWRLVAVVVLASLTLVFVLGADKDAGTGYELENVEVMDPKMRLADARRYMLTFNDALGVQCRDCHDLRDFAKDEGYPLKLIARDMMKMEAEINANWFPDAEEPVVNCATCHRGERIPSGSGENPHGPSLTRDE